MSNPNPLIPQGTFQAQAARGASNVRIAVATIVAIHVVFFGGLLLQGCKRDAQTGQGGESGERAQNTAAETIDAETNVSLALPPLDTNSLYYSSQAGLPPETGSVPPIQQPLPEVNPLIATPGTQQQTPEQLWQATNLNAPIGNGAGQVGGTMLNNGGLSAGMKEYTVVARDTLGKIAQQHGTTVSALMAANPNVEPRRIRPGDKILIPEGSPASAQSGAGAANQPAASAGDGSTTIYTVKSGDNLTRIANKYGVSIRQIRDANNMTTSRINVGQKLKIPAKQKTTASNGPANSNPTGL